jgi:hypothetical protein
MKKLKYFCQGQSKGLSMCHGAAKFWLLSQKIFFRKTNPKRTQVKTFQSQVFAKMNPFCARLFGRLAGNFYRRNTTGQMWAADGTRMHPDCAGYARHFRVKYK